MSKETIQKNLEFFGLSPVEACVYYSALSLDNAPADKIARHADTNRTSTYPILERLEKMGLVSRVKKKGKTVFQAAAPGKFLDMLDEKKEKINDVLPDLKNLFALQEGRPSVQLFSGTEGLKTVLNNILNEASTEVLIISDGESFLKRIPGWSDDYVMKRAKMNIRSRLIVKCSPYNIKAARSAKFDETKNSKMTKIRLLPESYDINYSGIDIYNNKVVFYSFDKQNVAVVVESKIINRLMRTIFEILWDTAEKYDHLFIKS
jgi:HTH-type transcriptional regulator, sugar sensing transcriptional regulator